MVPSLGVHVAAASVKATVRCPHWVACLAKKASLSWDDQRHVCSGRRLKPKRVFGCSPVLLAGKEGLG